MKQEPSSIRSLAEQDLRSWSSVGAVINQARDFARKAEN